MARPKGKLKHKSVFDKAQYNASLKLSQIKGAWSWITLFQNLIFFVMPVGYFVIFQYTYSKTKRTYQFYKKMIISGLHSWYESCGYLRVRDGPIRGNIFWGCIVKKCSYGRSIFYGGQSTLFAILPYRLLTTNNLTIFIGSQEDLRKTS